MAKNPHRASKNKNKRKADNEFTALTGIKAVQMEGGSNCLITKQKTANGMSVAKYAYIEYHQLHNVHKKRLKLLKVYHTCGVTNCVCKEHLKAHDPLKDVPPGIIF